MKVLGLLAISFLAVSCATTARTRDNDHLLRVAIDPKGMLDTEYRALRKALFDSGKFYVVDRAAGFEAVVREQDLEHKKLPKRFKDSEKWAVYGDLEGPGSVLKMEKMCRYQYLPFIIVSWWNKCDITITQIDASSGRVINQVYDLVNWVQPFYGMKNSSNFEDIVDELIATYPKNYNTLVEGNPVELQQKKAVQGADKAKEDVKSGDYQTVEE